MNNKGFTLTELIVTIALIGIISMIAFPSISKLKEENELEKYKSYEKVMKNGARLYVDSNRVDLWTPEEEITVRINYNTLIDAGLIEAYEVDEIKCNESYVCVTHDENNYISYDTFVICKIGDKEMYSTKKILDKKNISYNNCW